GLTQEHLATRLGKSRSHITNMLGLLNLPESIQKEVGEKKISMGHARVLSKLENEEQQKELATKVMDEGLSVRELESLTQEPDKYERTHKVNKAYKGSNEYKYLQEDLCEKLGTKVKIKNNKLEISFVNSNDLNRILEILHIETKS
ncbi:MAG: hypothetical protein IJ193_05580, partial [Bacilli bacterium]|nr:hypothetical protein [Bacilli bacterium]